MGYQSVSDESILETNDAHGSAEASDIIEDRHPRISTQAYGIHGALVHLGDLIRSPAIDITYYGRVPTFATCKYAITAIHRLPRMVSEQISEVGVPDELIAADDYDNREFVGEVGQHLVEATSNAKVFTLSVPDDLAAAGSGNEDQYDFRLCGLHEDVLHALKIEQYLELRFVNKTDYSAANDTIDLYEMHNVDHYQRKIV